MKRPHAAGAVLRVRYKKRCGDRMRVIFAADDSVSLSEAPELEEIFVGFNS